LYYGADALLLGKFLHRANLGQLKTIRLAGFIRKGVYKMDEATYTQYIEDFNSACTGSKKFSDFFDKYYEPDAIFEYIMKIIR
jgi:hypothetical protein